MVLGMTAIVGCGSSNASNSKIVLPIVQTADESLPSVAHPEFANWSQFEEKASVVRKRLVENANGTVVVTTKMWLDKKDENEVRVGSQVTVERPNEPAVENDVDIVRYPAKYRLPKGMDESRFYLPSAKAKETGTESVKVGENEIETKVFEWEENNESGPMTVKLWRSDKIPGKIVRQELFTKSSATKSTEEVIELRLSGDSSEK